MTARSEQGEAPVRVARARGLLVEAAAVLRCVLPTRWDAKLESDLDRIGRCVSSSLGVNSSTLTAVELMTIVLEDRRFFNHSGIDARALMRETIRALTNRRHGGASTIDMQFVRTATGYRTHTMRRKLYEAFLAILTQSRYSKLEILRSYLACAFFGSSLTGADAAAQKMFAKNANQLGLEDASLIGAMLACPRPLNGSPNWERRARRRANYGTTVYRANERHFSALRALAAEASMRWQFTRRALPTISSPKGRANP